MYSPTNFSQFALQNILSLKSVRSLHDMHVAEYSEYGIFLGCAAMGYPISNRNSTYAHAKLHLRVASGMFCVPIPCFPC